MEAINTVRQKRIRTDVYEPMEAANMAEGMKKVKYMMRTENFFSFKNYISLKRWNTEDAYKETINKSISFEVTDPDTNQTRILSYDFSLRPDSPLWIFPFPQSATNYNPTLTQNY